MGYSLGKLKHKRTAERRFFYYSGAADFKKRAVRRAEVRFINKKEDAVASSFHFSQSIYP